MPHDYYLHFKVNSNNDTHRLRRGLAGIGGLHVLPLAVAVAAGRLALLPRLPDEGMVDAQGALDAGFGAAGWRAWGIR